MGEIRKSYTIGSIDQLESMRSDLEASSPCVLSMPLQLDDGTVIMAVYNLWIGKQVPMGLFSFAKIRIHIRFARALAFRVIRDRCTRSTGLVELLLG